MLRFTRCYPILNIFGNHSTFRLIPKLHVSSRPLFIEKLDPSHCCIFDIFMLEQSSLKLSRRYLKRIDFDELANC